MQKKISIIIPCHNTEQYIDRCINSLLNQSIGLQHLELIFINDASPDNTLEKLLDYERQYPDDIIVINSTENLKQGGARNLGLRQASCDYIGFVDSDDWIVPTMYEKLYQKAVEYDCDVVTCSLKRVSDENDEMGPTGLSDQFIIIDDDLKQKDLLLNGLGSGLTTKLYRRHILEVHHIYFPEHLSYEDNYFGDLLLFHVKRIYRLEEYLYYYYINPKSTVITINSTHHFDRLQVELIKLSEYRKRGLMNRYPDEIEFTFIRLFYLNTLHITFTRFQNIPGDLLNMMKDIVKQNFPNYNSNKYLPTLSPTSKALLSTLDVPMLQEDWQMLASTYGNHS